MPYLRLLGGAVLEGDAGVVSGPAGRRHPLALLALLATAPARTLSRGKLVGLLWPDGPEKAARNRLNTCLHHIRSALGRDVVVSAGDDVRLDAEILGCDVCEFEEAFEAENHERAVDIYGGPFLDGFRLGGRSTAFEKRVDRERQRLRTRYLEALEELAEAAERREEFDVAARWWGERAGQDPYDSRVTRRLMEALDAAGNRAAALRSARVHAQLLEQEFGTGPGADLERLVHALETRSEVAEPGEPMDAGQPSEPSEPTEAGPPSEPGEPPTAGRPPPPGEPVPAVYTADNGHTQSDESRSRFPAAARSPGRKAPFVVAVAVGLVAAAAIAVFYLLGAAGVDERDRLGAGERSVAVLPFETIGGEEADPFTRGVHAGLLTRLSRIPELAVISDESVRLLQDANLPLPEAATGLGIGWIVRGDVQQVDDEVQVNARLVDARSDRQVWAETYRTSLAAGRLFEIQAEIVRQIATALEIRLGPEEMRRVAAIPTENSAAYELYLQGEALREAPSRDRSRLTRRVGLYRRALELDSTFADAWARLAHSYIAHAWSGEDPRLWADSAIMAANRALQLDPESAEAYVQLGNAYATLNRDLETSLRSYRTALDLEPSHAAAANNMVAFLSLRGRLAEALRAADRAHRLSPGVPAHLRGLILLNSELGRDDVVDAWLAVARRRGAEAVRAEFDVHLFHRGQPGRARALLPALSEQLSEIQYLRRRAALALYDRDWREARRLYRSLGPHVVGGSLPEPLPDALGMAYALARLGDRAEARAIAAEVAGENEPLVERADKAPRVRLAVALLLLDDVDGSLEWLERSVESGYRDARTLRSLPLLEPLRADPRFESLAARIDSLVALERQRVEAEGWGLPTDRSRLVSTGP